MNVAADRSSAGLNAAVPGFHPVTGNVDAIKPFRILHVQTSVPVEGTLGRTSAQGHGRRR